MSDILSPQHDELIQRAIELIPLLQKNRVEARTLRRIPDSNVAALKKAGLYQVLLSKRYGGFQAGLHTHLDVVIAIAQGCGSTAWCLGIAQIHSWLLAHFSQSAQDEVFGANPKAVIAAVLTPRGTSQKTQSGVTLKGFWPFGSHSQHSQWLILGTKIHVDSKEASDALCLVPTSEVQLQDDWDVSGLQGTGSCSLVANDVVVPEHRILLMEHLTSGEAPGLKLQEGHLYHSAVVPVLSLPLTATALGIAKGALAIFKEHLTPRRVVAYTYDEIQREMPVTHMQVAEASTKIDAAELLLRRSADDITQAAEKGEKMPLQARARVRMDCAYTVRLCLEAIEKLFLASGGSGISKNNPVQQAAQDLHAINLHGILVLETNLEMYGRLLLGLPQNTDLI